MLLDSFRIPFPPHPNQRRRNAAARYGDGVYLSISAFGSPGRYFLFALPLPPDDRDPPEDRDPPDDRERLPEDRADEELLEELRLTVEREGVDRFVEELPLTDRFPDEERFDVLSRLDGLSTDRDDFFPEPDRRTVPLFVDPRCELDFLTFLPVFRWRVVRSFFRWIVRPELSFLRRGFCVRRTSLDLFVDFPREILSRPCTILL